jgi:hypothetical protein
LTPGNGSAILPVSRERMPLPRADVDTRQANSFPLQGPF